MTLPGWLRMRFAKPAPAEEPEGLLFISVDEQGWHTTLLRPGEPPLHGESAAAAPGGASSSPLEMVRRAVRTVTPSQREQIGQVRLLVSDPAIVLVDNRLTRIRSAEPVAVRQAGAQELGCADAVFGFMPYGVSGEQEAERGVFAFLSTAIARDYIGGLDSLAAKLVQFAPIQFTRLAQVEDRPFIALTVASTFSTLMIGDPESGAMTSRLIPLGAHTFAKTLADATSMPVRQAAEGLMRRNCLPNLDQAANAPATATERALRPLMDLLKTEILASLDYMRFQRLGHAPELLLLDGDVQAIRGLEAWITQLLPLELQRGADIHPQFVGSCVVPSANLLEGSPKGMLKIGKNDYRFEGGRFVTEQPSASRPKPSRAKPASGWMNWQVRLPDCDLRRLGGPAIIVGLGIAGVVLALGQSDAALQDGVAAFSQAMAEDSVLRAATAHRLSNDVESKPDPLFLTEKLAAIARDLPDTVWLDRVATFNEGAASARDNRLTLEGSVALGAGDYLGRIDAFIGRLAADPAFMAGVASISLGNAVVAAGHEGRMASFTLSVVMKPPAAARRS